MSLALGYRVVIILGALAAAAAAAVVVIAVAGWTGDLSMAGDIRTMLDRLQHAPGWLRKLAGLGVAVSMAAVAFAIFAAEMLRLRAWIYYGAAAAIVVLTANVAFVVAAYFLVPGDFTFPELFAPGLRLTLISLTAALEASLFYWLVAGCNAGGWRDQWVHKE